MDSFIERFCAKYYFPYAEGRQLIEGMEYKTYRKGDCRMEAETCRGTPR